MQEKYAGNKNFRLVALSDEPAKTVTDFLKTNKVNYLVGAGARDTFKKYGVRGYPTLFVVDPLGKVVYKGHVVSEAEEAVEETLQTTSPKALLAGAERLVKRKQYARALKEFDRLARALGNTEAGSKAKQRAAALRADKDIMASLNAAEMKKKCEGWLDAARTLARSGKGDEALRYYQRVLDAYPDSSYARTAKAEISRLEL
jgi:tetratricopeptide (TPR) repeat protein